MSRTVSSPASRRRIASLTWCRVSFGLRPSFTPRALARAALGRAGADQLALEFSEAAEYGEHEAAVWGGGVGPRVAEGAEACFPAGDRRESIEKIAGRACQAVEARHHEHVAGVELVEGTAKLAAVGLHSARHLTEHGRRPRGAKLGHLGGDALAVGRDSGIAIDHGGDSAPKLRTGKAISFQGSRFGAKFLSFGSTESAMGGKPPVGIP